MTKVIPIGQHIKDYVAGEINKFRAEMEQTLRDEFGPKTEMTPHQEKEDAPSKPRRK